MHMNMQESQTLLINKIRDTYMSKRSISPCKIDYSSLLNRVILSDTCVISFSGILPLPLDVWF